MKKLPATPLALVIGIGFLITKSMTPASSGDDAGFRPAEGGAPSNLRTRSSSGKSSAGRSTTGRTASSPRSLAALMELAGDHLNNQNSIAFLKAVERLGADEIAAMMIDLEKLDPTDPRRYRL